MQFKGLHKNLYRLYAYSRKQETLYVYQEKYISIVKKWEHYKFAGLKDNLIQEIVGCSRATYYRAKKILAQVAKGIIPPSKAPKKRNKSRWGESEKQLVLRIRRENPTYGKEKIQIILKRDHSKQLSISTVGMVLKMLFGKGLVTKSMSAPRARKKRNFCNRHAKSWTYKDYKKMSLGERVQIDHMSVTKNNVGIKHFQAWDRRSKFIHAQAYSHAKSTSAKRFLDELLAKSPFTINSIQVDGGSEFMADFEQACADYQIELIVLPPSKPTYNGGVERGNRIFREEFYESNQLQADSLGAIKNELTKALQKYNHYRPHSALKGLTPMEYINNHNLEAT